MEASATMRSEFTLKTKRQAMARAGRDTQGRIADLVQLTPGGVRVDPSFSAEIEAALRTGDPDATRRDIAASMQDSPG